VIGQLRPNHLRPTEAEPISTLAPTGRFRSGQTGQTVNLLAYAFAGSNPALPTLSDKFLVVQRRLRVRPFLPPRKDVDLRRLVFVFRAPRLRPPDLAEADFPDVRFFPARPREDDLVRDLGVDFFRERPRRVGFAAALAFRVTFLTFFVAERSPCPLAAAFPARAPTTPPTTAPTGPATLPSAAPATAPAVCFGIDGRSMLLLDCWDWFCSASESKGINCGAPYI
jgi:hypothetical protein